MASGFVYGDGVEVIGKRLRGQKGAVSKVSSENEVQIQLADGKVETLKAQELRGMDFHPVDCVEAFGLTSESGRSLNGKIGIVTRFVPESGRFEVSFPQSKVNLRPENLRKPTPVTIPEKGAYLKKSPSPTGTKSPLGGEEEGGLSPGSGEEGGGALVASQQQTDITDHCETGLDENYEENEDGSKLGRLFFTVKYSFEKTALIVTINKCSNLPAKDSTNKTSDPYVKLQLLPEKQHKVKTRVVRRTLHPVYDEDFTFYGVHFNQLPILTLHFVVLSFDRYSRDDVVGEVMVELDGMDLGHTDVCPLTLSREINPRSDKLRSQGRGELLVSLCHQPAASRVTVVVLKARNLPKMDITGLSDPYVKIYLLYNNQRISKKKTHVKKRTLNPVFNESFVFDLPKTTDGSLTQIGRAHV